MNSYPSPQYRQEDQDQNGILRALGGIALTAGAGVGLLYGLDPKRRQSLRQGIANFVNDEKVAENLKKARAASSETKTAAFRSETPGGTQVVDLNSTERSRGPRSYPVINLNPSSFNEFSQQADQIAAKVAANIDPSVDLDLLKSRLANAEQGNFALNYNKTRGAVAPQADSRLTETTPAQVTLGLATPGSGFRKFSEDAEKIRREDFVDRFIRENRDDYLKAKERQQDLLEAGEIGRESQRQTRAIEMAEAQEILAQLKEEKALGLATPGSGFRKFSEDASVTSVQRQQMAEGQVAAQSLEAIDTGADQAAMRVSRTVQRDPGENLTEFDLVQDAYEQRGASPVQAADAAVAATEGNVAFTQTDAPVHGPISAQEMADDAKFKMMALRAEVARLNEQPNTITTKSGKVRVVPSSTVRTERALAERFKTGEATKIGDLGITGTSLGKVTLPAGAMRQTVQGVETSNSPSFFSRSLPNVGEDPYSELTQAASGSSIRGRSRVQNQPDQFRQRVDSQGRPIEDDVVVRDAGGTNTYSMGEELSELVMNDPDAPASYTRMVRNPYTGEMTAEWAPKGKRVIQMYQGEGQPTKPLYVPQDDPGGIGIYGVERSYAAGPVTKFGENIGDYTGTAQRVPTDLPYTERRKNSSLTDLSTPQLQEFAKNAVDKNPRAAQAATSELSRRENTKQNLQISESMRRARIEGRDPQSVLREFGIGV